jgi:hypothetical protein
VVPPARQSLARRVHRSFVPDPDYGFVIASGHCLEAPCEGGG